MKIHIFTYHLQIIELKVTIIDHWLLDSRQNLLLGKIRLRIFPVLVLLISFTFAVNVNLVWLHCLGILGWAVLSNDDATTSAHHFDTCIHEEELFVFYVVEWRTHNDTCQTTIIVNIFIDVRRMHRASTLMYYGNRELEIVAALRIYWFISL